MSNDELSGRTALVTGASGVLGAATCRALLERGAVVVGSWHLGEQRAARLAADADRIGGVLHLVAADLTDPADRLTLVRRVEQLSAAPDILVCAHGDTRRLGILNPRVPNSCLWSLNVEATVDLAARTAKGMLRRRFGRIVLLGSRAGTAGMPGQAEYAATKAALAGWAASAAWELGAFGITVNVVAPGAVESGPDSLYTAEENELAASRTAVRRLGTPSEIAAVVAFLAGPTAGFMSGQTLVVDGGARW